MKMKARTRIKALAAIAVLCLSPLLGDAEKLVPDIQHGLWVIPAGEYEVEKTIVIPSDTIVAGRGEVVLRGVELGATPIFRLKGAKDVSLQHLTFESQRGVHIESGEDITLVACHFRYTPSPTTEGPRYGLDAWAVSGLSVTHCTSEVVGVRLGRKDHVVEGVWFNFNTLTTIRIVVGRCFNVNIEGNRITDGIESVGHKDGYLREAKIRGNTILKGSGWAIALAKAQEPVVIGNVLVAAQSVSLWGGTGGVVAGNVIAGLVQNEQGALVFDTSVLEP